MSAPVLSRQFIAEGCRSVPSLPPFVSPGAMPKGAVASTTWASGSALAALSSEPFLIPKLRNYFADFPYLHYSSWPEAANLGDLMRLWVRPGVKLSHLAFHGPSRAHLTPRKVRSSSRHATLSLVNPTSGSLVC